MIEFSGIEFCHVDNLEVAERRKALYQFLVDQHSIEPFNDYHEDVLHIFSRDVLRLMREGDDSWEKMVPDPVASLIRERALFGYRRIAG
jgi:hypothetical protein